MRIALDDIQIEVIDNKKGLASNNLRYIAFDNDTCWAAGGKGLSCIPLREFNREHVRGYIRQQGIQINNQSVDASASITIQHNDLVSIMIDGISYTSNKEFQLVYRIRGHATDWIAVSGLPGILEIPRLPAGNIVIEVKMIDYLGIDSVNTLQFRFEVIPPFWQRWWFYTLLVLIFALISFLIFLNRIRVLRKKQQQTLRRLSLENELRLTHQNALKAQMNPHFIFNVLNSIKGYIYENDKKNAARYLSDFSNLVRKILDMSSLAKVSLSEEIDALKVYIDLEAMLLQGDFHYSIFVDDNLDTSAIYIPALLVQPYIENTFNHGLRHKAGRKELNIFIELNEIEEMLIIKLQDNGIGRKASGLINNENRPEHRSFATEAIKKRIELLNHDENNFVRIEILDNFDSAGLAAGTTVIIQIHV